MVKDYVRKMENVNFCFYESKFSVFGVLLVIIGAYYLGTHLGWWIELPFWPLVAIFLGLYLIIKRLSYRRV